MPTPRHPRLTDLRLLVVTDRQQAGGVDGLLDVTTSAVRGGARWFLLREKDLPSSERAALARSLANRLPADGGLILASDLELARTVGAFGVHLAAADPWPDGPALESDEGRLLVGRSCHDLDELREAQERGADYVTLSPVFASRSKPDYGPSLGLGELARLCDAVPDLPVLALGGISVERVGPCLAAGAAGVAVMGEVMRSTDPARTVAQLRAELLSVDGLTYGG